MAIEIDRNSATWKAVEAWIAQRRQDAVDALISGAEHNDRYRGEIRALDALLEHGQPTRKDVIPPINY